MTLTLAEIDRWDPQAMRDVAAAAADRAAAAAETSAALELLPVLAQWDGLAAAAARLSIAVTRAELDAHAEQAGVVARAAGEAADAVAALKADLRDLEDDARAASLEIDHDSAQVHVIPGYRSGAADSQVREEALADVSARLTRILARADEVDARLALAVTPRAPGGGEPGGEPAPSAAERDRANRVALAADLDRVAGVAERAGVAVPQVLAEPDRFGVSDAEVTRYANAARVQDGLADAVLRTGVPVLLWAYSPEAFGGQGRAAIAINDPDLAQDTAVVVPGTGNSVAAGWLGADEPANLFNELALAEPGVAHSVIAWMGYDAPDSMADPRVARPGLARRGGALLAADVTALAAAHRGTPGHLTVIGHSYGSTTVADAAAGNGMPADDVVLLGSPGTDLARSAADFHLDAGQVYVGSAATDPVTHIAGLPGVIGLGAGLPGVIGLGAGLPGVIGLGADPAAEGYGSTRFKAEVPEWNWNPVDEHLGYFGNGSESLFSITDVAAGQGELLRHHGMTAPHRGAALGPLATALGLPDWSLPLTDPELDRAATSGHRH